MMISPNNNRNHSDPQHFGLERSPVFKAVAVQCHGSDWALGGFVPAMLLGTSSISGSAVFTCGSAEVPGGSRLSMDLVAQMI